MTLKALSEQFDKMPIFGRLRQLNRRLTFGQYLIVLKDWWDKTEREKKRLEMELCEMHKKWKLVASELDRVAVRDVIRDFEEILGKCHK